MAAALLAEFRSPHALIAATARLEALGYRDIETFSPFPLPEVERHLGLRRTRIPFFVLGAGLSGVAIAFLVIWWTSARSYPLDVGGRPLNSFLADVPIMFETGILFASATAFFLVLRFSGLPRLHNPLFDTEGFSRASLDRFWVLIDTDDPAFEPSIEDELLHAGALAVRTMKVRPT
jgi:hypothetical protein